MSIPPELHKEVKKLYDIIKNEHGTTAEQFAQWVKDRGKKTSGFSAATISHIYTGNGAIKDKNKVEEYCKLCKEFIEGIEQGTIKVQSSISISKKSKLSLYLNRNYYLYFFETRKAKDDNFIGRVVLKIGATENEVHIYNSIEGERDNSTNYKGTIMMHPNNDNHIILRLQTTEFAEKDLKIIFRVLNEKETKYMIGGYMNIDRELSVIMGTIIAERTQVDDPKPEVIRPQSETYEKLSPHIKKFLYFKDKNFIKIRSKGIFSDNDFVEFFNEQEKKSVVKSNTGEGKIFVAYPMSSIPNFEDFNIVIKDISEHLQTVFNVTVYFAGNKMTSKNDLKPPLLVISESKELLDNCDKFLMIFPQSTASGCLIELGYAIAAKKPCTIFYKNLDDLPYMLRDEINLVKKFSYKDDDDLIQKIQKIGLKLF